MASNAHSFASSASLLIALQFGSRLFTFGLNQALLRFVSPRAFGTAAIQFELLSSTILFLSREGFRNALIRAWNDHGKKNDDSRVASETVNLTFLPTIIGIPVSILASLLYCWSCSKETASQPYFDLAVILYAVASCIELISEPLHIRAMGELRTSLRVRAEGAGIIAKTGSTFLVILAGERAGGKGVYALIAFALGQLAYAMTVLFIYVRHYGVNSLKPRRLPGSINKSFNSQYLKLSLSMTMQSVFKHILTEGDKFLVSHISALEDQGGYALANNYGSLVARILFQPVEEMSRVFFSKKLASGDNRPVTSSEVSPEARIEASTTNEGRVALKETSRVLTSILSVQTGLGFILCSFGPPFLPLLLRFALPRRYLTTSAPELLQAWIWYIPVMAINGVLEAFVSSAATPADVHRQSRWMAAFSAVFVLATGLFYRLGQEDVSLIYGNIVNLVSRLLFAAHFISGYYKQRGADAPLTWTSTFPHWTYIALVGLCGSVLRAISVVEIVDLKRGHRFSTELILPLFRHIGIGSLLISVCGTVWWMQTGRHLVLPARR